VDIDGDDRVIDTLGKGDGNVDIDMGADETTYGRWYVKTDGSNSNDGKSWDKAFATISYAIGQASDNEVINVAVGTYNESIDFDGLSITITSTDPQDPYVMENTIINANGSAGSPARVVTFNDGEDPNSVLCGFTLTGGYAPGTGIARDGGGIFCYGSSPTISNCIISDNYAGDDGGGIFCDSGSDAKISDCTVSGNESADKGGGIYCRNSCPEIVDCAFDKNTAGTDGGGLYCRDKNPVIKRCIFTSNTAGDDGGGIQTLSCGPTITSSVFHGNAATDKGGAMYLRDDDTVLINCTITENTAVYGGGIYNRYSDTEITNCILWDDTASTSGNEIYNYSSTPVVTYSDVEGGWSGTGNINTDPLFVDDYHLGANSPCIDVGDSGRSYTGELDIDGDNRVIDISGKGDGTVDVDMGADEYKEQ
jgi:predicted outer membrane repeat protein